MQSVTLQTHYRASGSFAFNLLGTFKKSMELKPPNRLQRYLPTAMEHEVNTFQIICLEDGTDRMFRNVGQYKPDGGETPKSEHTGNRRFNGNFSYLIDFDIDIDSEHKQTTHRHKLHYLHFVRRLNLLKESTFREQVLLPSSGEKKTYAGGPLRSSYSRSLVKVKVKQSHYRP
jgi:hypothetical protein